MRIGPEKKARKLRKFIQLYEESPKMRAQVEQARKELVGYERLVAWLQARAGVQPQGE
jgi:hypothetical protein